MAAEATDVSFPGKVFQDLLGAWPHRWTGYFRRMAATAMLKDVLALCETQPSDVCQRFPEDVAARRLIELCVSDTAKFMRVSLLPTLRSLVDRHASGTGASKRVRISSPLCGGIPAEVIQRAICLWTRPAMALQRSGLLS